MTADELRAIAARLEEHADLHGDLANHDTEQAQWERDLRSAAAYLRIQRHRIQRHRTAKSKEPDMQSAWISVQDRMPPDDTPVLVYVPGSEMMAFAIDQWQMQREAPLGWSSATIETGMGWCDHDYEDVSHWMPLTAPGQPFDIDDQLIADEYAGMLRMIDEAMGDDDDR